MKPGDVIKFKFHGMKTKFRVMNYDEEIKEKSVHALIDIDTHGDPEKQYTEVLDICSGRPLLDWVWLPTCAAGDHISDGHTCRVYLEQLTNYSSR